MRLNLIYAGNTSESCQAVRGDAWVGKPEGRKEHANIFKIISSNPSFVPTEQQMNAPLHIK